MNSKKGRAYYNTGDRIIRQIFLLSRVIADGQLCDSVAGAQRWFSKGFVTHVQRCAVYCPSAVNFSIYYIIVAPAKCAVTRHALKPNLAELMLL